MNHANWNALIFRYTLWLLVRQEAFDLGLCRQEANSYPALTYYVTVDELTEYELTAGPIATWKYL